MSETFRLGYVPGATPGKWARTWRERVDVPLDLVQVDAADAVAALDRGEVDAAVARLPVDKSRLSAILLYEELPVVVVSREHLLAATEEEETVSAADVADDVVHLPADDVLYGAGAPVPGLRPVAYREDGTVDVHGTPERPPTTAEAIAWVAAGAGVTIVPMSLARLHHRKDVAYRVLDGGPTAPVGLVWVSERTTDLVDELVGIVRGRTVNSSRGRAGAQQAGQATTAKPALTAKQDPRRTSRSGGGVTPSGKSSRAGGTKGTKGAKGAKGSKGSKGSRGSQGRRPR